MDWNDLRHFLALARTGSIRGAGASLGVSHTTVARRVEALEQDLSTRLFDRSRAGYELTDAGRRMLESAERTEGELSALERDLVGRDERLAGPVRITCCDAFVAGLVLPDLERLCQQNPGIQLEMDVDSRIVDLSRREADIAIRALTGEPPGHLVGARLAPLMMGIYGSVDHVGVLGNEGAPAIRWVGFDDGPLMQSLIQQTPYAELPVWGAFRSLELMVRAVRMGMGIALLPTYVAENAPGLVRMGDTLLGPMATLWLVSHPDLRTNARLRATRSVLRRSFENQQDLFCGVV